MADVNSVINKCVDDIWAQYDKDNSGALDKEESRAFITATLTQMEQGDASFTEDDFNACFAEFDTDGNGTISRAEMAAFIKKVAGL